MSTTKNRTIIIVFHSSLRRAVAGNERLRRSRPRRGAAAPPPPPPPLGAARPKRRHRRPRPRRSATATPGTPATPTPPPPPYSLPWQLRPVAAVERVALRHRDRVLRQRHGRFAAAPWRRCCSASYKVTPSLAPLVRLGVSQNDAPAVRRRRHLVRQSDRRRHVREARSTRSAGRRSWARPSRSAAAAATRPTPAPRRANAAGIRARSAMDNAMFAVNYFTAIAGGGVAYVDHKLTVQLEATLLQLFRVRGDTAAVRHRFDAHQLDGRPARRVLHHADAVASAASFAISAGCPRRRSRRWAMIVNFPTPTWTR